MRAPITGRPAPPDERTQPPTARFSQCPSGSPPYTEAIQPLDAIGSAVRRPLPARCAPDCNSGQPTWLVCLEYTQGEVALHRQSADRTGRRVRLAEIPEPPRPVGVIPSSTANRAELVLGRVQCPVPADLTASADLPQSTSCLGWHMQLGVSW